MTHQQLLALYPTTNSTFAQKFPKTSVFATVAVGYIYYYFGDNSNFVTQDAQEAYASISRAFFGYDFAATYYWDIETDNDSYSEPQWTRDTSLAHASL